jgi:hypothetical protein
MTFCSTSPMAIAAVIDVSTIAELENAAADHGVPPAPNLRPE